MFSNVISELGKRIGLPELAPDADGALTLTIDRRNFTLQYFEAGEELYIIHRLAELPLDTEPRLAVQDFLLRRNCFFRGVGTGVLGTEGDAVFYSARLSVRELSGLELERFLQAVVDICAVLRRDMVSLREDPTSSSDTPAEDEFMRNMLRV